MKLRAIALATVVVLSGAAWLWTSRAVALPAYGEVPAFALTDERGAAVTSLVGRPHVVDFMFTSCPTACPLLTAQMQSLQTDLVARGLRGKVELTSISVDPERDTADKLAAYGKSHGADPAMWRFLRGDEHELERVVVDGMKQAMERGGRTEKGDLDDFAFVHGTRFVLLDEHARIRGFYDANDAASMARLREDVVAVAQGRATLADPS